MKNNTIKVQPLLNLDHVGFEIVQNLELEDLRKYLQIVTKKKISTRSIVDLAKAGKFEISCPSGNLTIIPSEQGEFLWDVIFCPIAVIPKSA